jgi:hypothetical protein
MARPKGQPKLGGRKKGTPNKSTIDLKGMILGALDQVGGQQYLAQQAIENPGPFLTLVGKCLPKDLNTNVTLNKSELLQEIVANLPK